MRIVRCLQKCTLVLLEAQAANKLSNADVYEAEALPIRTVFLLLTSVEQIRLDVYVSKNLLRNFIFWVQKTLEI